jgi:hypothetical protein
MTKLHVTRLVATPKNSLDDVTIGYFTSNTAKRAAVAAWKDSGHLLREFSTYLILGRLERVDPGDGDRVEYLVNGDLDGHTLGSRVGQWLAAGANRVEVSRFVVDTWRGPDGGVQGAGSIIVDRLVVKAVRSGIWA